MEQTTEFDLELALKHYLNTLNSNGILSKMDQDELLDHLYSEIETLEDSGLSTEEAFIISQTRLGDTKVIKSEYHKAKPWTRVIQLLLSTIMLGFFIKLILNLVNIFSLPAPLILNKLSIVDMNLYLEWGDLGVKIGLLIISLGIGAVFLKKMVSARLKDLWVIPVLFVISEIVSRAMFMFFIPIMEPSTTGTIIVNSAYISYGIVLFGLLFSIGLMVRYKNLRLQFG